MKRICPVEPKHAERFCQCGIYCRRMLCGCCERCVKPVARGQWLPKRRKR